jgi:site-specific DNA-cytosine methylase
MKILSLFDGISCGHVALERAGIPVTEYHACEIDKYAIQISQKNYPDNIQHGSVVDYHPDRPFDLIIGGSPCQGFSFAGKQLAFNDPRSKLFFEFVRILIECQNINPNIKFLLENVKMKKEHSAAITRILGVEPILINSALVSAQNRQRYYWTNILGISQPKDCGILLPDILQSGVSDRDKSYCIDANYWNGGGLENYFRKSRRQVVFTERRTEEAKRIRSEYMKLGRDFSPRRAKEHILLDEAGVIRKLTPVECERLQTLPDGYTGGGFGYAAIQNVREWMDG